MIKTKVIQTSKGRFSFGNHKTTNMEKQKTDFTELLSSLKTEREIEIKFLERDETKPFDDFIGPGWFVRLGDRYADGLAWEEMLGVIVGLTLERNPRVPCLAWMKTKEGHRKYRAQWLKKDGEKEVEND